MATDGPPDDVLELLAQVTHELRTPLAPIRGLIHTLQRRDDELSAAERQQIYEVLLREEQRLEHLVTSLLQAATPDYDVVAGRDALSWPSIVHEQVDLYRAHAPARAISLTDDSGGRPVVADADLSVGVLVNLLANAIAHSPVGSPIDVILTSEPDRVVTTVADHGGGISPDDRNRVFERFVRVGEHHMTRPGVGLGLFIARRSVHAMGGEIWCDETPGGGARFGFSLPAGDAISSR